MRKSTIGKLFIALTVMAIASLVSAEVKVAEIFTDNMVLQRELPVPVWGTAVAGEKITVSFAGQAVGTTADDTGTWMVTLEPLKTSAEGRTMTVNGSNAVTFNNVVVGEVWLCSGQSNMGGTLKEHEQEIIVSKGKEIDLTRYRYLNRNEGWLPINGDTYSLLSRVSYYYGIKLYEELNEDGIKVPVGLVPRARSGSAIQSWMPKSAAEKIRKKTAIPEGWNADKAHHEPGNQFAEQLDMIIPYAIRGAIWYQGESNKGEPWEYRHLLPHLIETWRNIWAVRSGSGLRRFPFYYVQVPVQNKQPGWPVLRDSMRRVLDVTENTGMAVFYDYGPEVHPPIKEPVGTRLALWALAKDYGRDIVCSGPLLDNVQIKDGTAVLSFRHVGGGLKNKSGGENLRFFEIAGKDGKYVQANAWIEGDTVVVQSDQIPAPATVRYLFRKPLPDPAVSLINAEGLPASPFITDDIRPAPVAIGSYTLQEQLAQEEARAKLLGREFKPDRITTSFHKQDMNGDGIIDQTEVQAEERRRAETKQKRKSTKKPDE
ncbi:MAG: hypothetical protein K9M45_05285 [Kiritimatiellales bacterium]|nr:hypothetical protein [Kiritimatiellales bacterium]